MVGTTVLDIFNVKQILTMIIKINYFRSPFWFALISSSDINERYAIVKPSSTSIFELFYMTTNLGISGFSCRIFLIFESSQLSQF